MAVTPPPASGPVTPGGNAFDWLGTAKGIAAEVAGLAFVGAAIYLALAPGHGVGDPAFPALTGLAGFYLGGKAG